ncbi:MAG: carbohydrate ABC transporter permease [Candidatus Hydrogenedentes bacterium]|nr:carbohydrate ABC transporter permease [Candidatus Hydrogenedentota bacterium]
MSGRIFKTLPRTNDRGTILGGALIYGVLLVYVALLMLPFFWMIITSLKPITEVVSYPPNWWPREFSWRNYVEAWQAAPFGRFAFNSLVTGIAATFLQVTLALFMAYAFAVLRFPMKNALLIAVLATLMIPDEVKLVPNYLLLRKLGWVNTYWALIVPPLANAFPVFVFHQQFRVLPRDLIDAGRMDGAGHVRILLQIVTPISRAVVAAVALTSFLGRWNDYLWPLIVTNERAMRTLPIGLAYLKDTQEGGNQWNLLMAGAVFVMMPVVILYGFTQRQFVEGLTKGALKG